jgi:hypothetical protein
MSGMAAWKPLLVLAVLMVVVVLTEKLGFV